MTEELCKAVLRMTREVTDKLENLNLARPNIPLPIYSGVQMTNHFILSYVNLIEWLTLVAGMK